MIKRASLLALVICCLLALLSPGMVRADNGLAVLSSSAEIDFPLNLGFSLSTRSDVDITDIRLHYRVDRMEHAQITSEVYIEFAPANEVTAQWVWDMRKTGGLPPGSSVDYWWTVTDAGGNRLETAPTRVLVEDNRYDWRSLTEGKITIYWYQGDDDFGSELMATAQQALARLSADTGVELEKSVKIYIYANSQDLQGSMIFPQEWTGGVAFTRYGIIAIGIAPNELAWGSRTIAHELTHLVIHQVTFNPYSDLPTWLDEGLAMKAEGEMEAVFARALYQAYDEGKLISVQSLSSPFSAYAEESILAYAQSYSLEAFLIEAYGQAKMFELLNTFKQGSGYDEALEKVYGFDMDGLDALWQNYTFAEAIPAQPETEEMPAVLVGVLAGLLTGLLLSLVLFIERWAWRRGW
jgi:hypothetical protein